MEVLFLACAAYKMFLERLLFFPRVASDSTRSCVSTTLCRGRRIPCGWATNAAMLVLAYCLSQASNTPAQASVSPARAAVPPISISFVAPVVGRGPSIRPDELTVLQDELIFSSVYQNRGIELLAFDGSQVSMLADINPNGSSDPEQLIVLNDTLYFVADDGSTGRELWSYDGALVSQVQDAIPGPEHPDYAGFGTYAGELYTGAFKPDVGRELLRLQGSQIDTAADIWLGSNGSMPYAAEFVVYQDELYFGAETARLSFRLWKFDGSQASIVDNSIRLATGFFFPTVFDGSLYFNGNQSLFAFDGIDVTLAASEPNPAHMTDFGNELVYSANTRGGPKLLSYDGQSSSVIAGQDDLKAIQSLIVFGDLLFLVAREDAIGWGIYTYDGTQISRVREDLGATQVNYPPEFPPTELTVFQEALYFISADSNDYGLWRLQVVPEPTTATLTICGALVLLGFRRKPRSSFELT